jgi:tetratricopeptide (TPR) repeat protein
MSLHLRSLILSLLCSVLTVFSISAQTARFLQLHVTAGVSTPMPKFRFQPMFAGLGSYYEGGFDYFFGKIGITTSAGALYHPTQRLFTNFITDRYNAEPYNTLTSKWGTKYGMIGGIYKFSHGAFECDLSSRIGFSKIDVPSMAYVKPFEQRSLELFSFYGIDKNEWQPTYSVGTRFVYRFSPMVGVHLKADLLSALKSRTSTYTTDYVDLQDRNKNGSLENSDYFDSPRLSYTGNVNIQTVNIGMGFVFQLGRAQVKAPSKMFEGISIEDRPDGIDNLTMSVPVPQLEEEKTTSTFEEIRRESAAEISMIEQIKPTTLQSSTKPIVVESYIAPESKYDAEAAQFLYKAGEAYFVANDYESAMTCFNKLKADPLYPYAKYMFAMTLGEMGNCEEAATEFADFESKYKGADARTLSIIFKSQIEKCKSNKGSDSDDAIASNVANGVSYKIQFIAMKQSNAIFPRLAEIKEVGKEFLKTRGIYRYNLETYFDLAHATKDMNKVRSLGYPDAFIAVYNDGRRVNTLHHAK